MGSAFGAAGQRCLAGSVCVIAGDEARQAEVREALRSAAAEALTTGPGADPGTDVCPMVAPEARERAEAAVAAAESDGADGPSRWPHRRRRGRGAARPDAGRRRRSASRSWPARRSSGPVLALVGVPDLDAAIEFANGSRYGNAGSIFTTSGSAARAYRWGVEAGMLGVNIGVPAPVAWFPFSGWKDSLDGDLHANGRDAVDFYTRKKVVTSRW